MTVFQATKALANIARMNKRVNAIQGGTGAGKTYAILANEINYCCTFNNISVSVVSMTFPHLRRGAIRDFVQIMKTTGRWIDSHWNKTDHTYNFANGSYIEFFSADNSDKLHGPRRDRLYLNEANNLTFEAYNTLAVRTNQKITMDWNPTHKFWFHKELAQDKNVAFLKMTYKDNEACPLGAIEFIEQAKEKAKTSAYWDNWYRVYGLGELGVLQEVIFQDWSIIDKIPDEAQLLGYGLDFGYTHDPTAVVAAYRYNGKMIYDELIYQRKLNDYEVANMLKTKGVDNFKFIYCDPSSPKSIDELYAYGLNARKADAGRDSIKFGIELINQSHFLVTKNSTNLIKELNNYAWDKDKNGNILSVPIDNFNHGIDAMRYVMMSAGAKSKTRINSGRSRML